MKTLFDVEVGKSYKIMSTAKAALRLCELGLIEGQRVKVIARSMFKHATLIEVRGYLLSVRTSLLKSVVVR